MLKPFILFLMLCMAAVIARLIYPLIPNGKIKQILYDKEVTKRHPYLYPLAGTVMAFVVIALVGLALLG